MPGTKIELKSGDDPDPAPFLFVSAELKQKIAEKQYDPKRSCYVPHPEEKFCEGIVEETTGNKVKVRITGGASAGETKEYKQDLVAQVGSQTHCSYYLHISHGFSRSILPSMIAARICPA